MTRVTYSLAFMADQAVILAAIARANSRERLSFVEEALHEHDSLGLRLLRYHFSDYGDGFAPRFKSLNFAPTLQQKHINKSGNRHPTDTNASSQHLIGVWVVHLCHQIVHPQIGYLVGWRNDSSHHHSRVQGVLIHCQTEWITVEVGI